MSGSVPGPAQGPPVPRAAARGRSGRGRRVRFTALVVVAVVLVAGAFWTVHEAGGYYTYQPGTAPTITVDAACAANASGSFVLPGGAPCARLVIGGGHGHALSGRLLMVDVLVGKANPVEWLLDKVHLLDTFEQGAQLIPAPDVLGSTPASQLGCEDSQDMSTASETAPLVALQRLGYKVGVSRLGARVYVVLSGTAASRAGLACDDLITAIDGSTVGDAADVERLIRLHRPGAQITVTVRRPTGTGTAVRTLRATLGSVPALDGQPASPSTPFLGIETEDDTTYQFPFPVSVEVGDIGGPSAGLALTLGLLDALSNGRLTGGHVVAATGTINPDGSVGDVGGVKQKTVAVRRAGATLFLVPPQELATARSEAGRSMTVKAVSSVSQALADLKAIGGDVPAATAPTPA